MKNMFKNWNIGGLLVLLFAVMLTVSWKSHEAKKAEGKWYQVSLLDEEEDADEPTNQKIDGLYPGGEPSFPCEEDEGVICAVFLDLENKPMPSTIAQADSLSIDTSTRVHRAAEN